MLEAEGEMEKTWKFKQRDIKDAVDVQSSQKVPSRLTFFLEIYILTRR